VVDVLLTHSYHLYYDRKQTRRMQRYPPLGTLYAAALLRSHGISVAVFDSMLNDPQEGFQGVLEQHRPSIVVVARTIAIFVAKCVSPACGRWRARFSRLHNRLGLRF
jgi:anaerobic magnesium-protoporphyrin IX monomethyl ester cyclase